MEYNVPINSNSHLDIFSTTGELVKSYSGLSGSGNLSWDGSNEMGRKISSGTYFALLISNSGILSSQKLMLIR
jgi:flagellar hook assembly protein FlgD